MNNFFNTRGINIQFKKKRRKKQDLLLERITNNLVLLPRRINK